MTTQNLETALLAVESPIVREELLQAFHIVNPIEFARLLDARGLPIPVKAKLLALKVALPPAYKGIDLSPLIEREMQAMWTRLGAEFPSSAE